MKLDALQLSLLFDYYSELLTEKQKICFDLYYNQDLSLAEIAAEAGISRQGVHDSIARAEAILKSMEEKTGWVAYSLKSQRALAQITEAASVLQQHSDPSVQQLANHILAAADLMKE